MRVAAATRHRSCPQAVALTAKDGRSQARCRRDQFVSGAVHAFGRVPVIPDVTIPRHLGARVLVIRRLTAFAAVSAREGWAVTGRFREKYLSRLTGPARRYEVAYVPLHRV